MVQMLKRQFKSDCQIIHALAQEQKPEFIPVWDYSYDGLTAQSANKPKVFYKEPSIAGLYISVQPLECEKKMYNIL